MNVAFLIHDPEASSSRYRVLQYLPFLERSGIEATVRYHGGRLSDRLKFFKTLGCYDVVYILRKLFSPVEFLYLRKKARKIIYDFDDAVMYRSSFARSHRSFSRRTRFAFMMRRVDKIIAGNCYLESEAKRYNPNVVVIPTSIDTSRYSLKDDSPADRPPVVGWIGSSSTLKYLEEIAPALRAIYRRYRDITLKIVSDRFIDDPELPIVKKRWSSAEEVSDLKSFDIGLMPLSDDPWSRGKCGLKILQYFAVGIPVVCSPVGVNREIVQDGINGFWASREEEWEERIESLIVDGSLRREMGINGYMTLRKGFTLEVNAPRLLSVLKEVGKSH